jgi:hypothetical protein
LKRLPDSQTRYEIIDAVRPKIDPSMFFNLAVLATGGHLFKTVRDLEHGWRNGKDGRPPLEHFRPGPMPSLTTILFDERRDDKACRAKLQELARTPRHKCEHYAAWILDELEQGNEPDPSHLRGELFCRGESACAEIIELPRQHPPPPPEETPALRKRALDTSESEVAERILDELETAHGLSRRDVLKLAAERLTKRGNDAISPTWLAKRLDTISLWKEPGAEILRLLLEKGTAKIEGRYASQLCFESSNRAYSDEVYGTHPPTTPRRTASDAIRAIHEALATALVEMAEGNFRHNDMEQARRALLALAHLNGPSWLWPRVRKLRDQQPPDDVLAVIELNEKLLRRSGKNDASTNEGLLGALRAVAGVDEFGDPV